MTWPPDLAAPRPQGPTPRTSRRSWPTRTTARDRFWVSLVFGLPLVALVGLTVAMARTPEWPLGPWSMFAGGSGWVLLKGAWRAW